MIDALFRFFETRIQPFAHRPDLRPPRDTLPFIWFYVRQARAPFLMMLVLDGLTAAI